MSFVREDGEFEQLLGIVARETGIAAALVEKDYWVTHTLWALHETGLEIWRWSQRSSCLGSGSNATGVGATSRPAAPTTLVTTPACSSTSSCPR